MNLFGDMPGTSVRGYNIKNLMYAEWVSTGVYEAKGVNPYSTSGGRDPKAVGDLTLLIPCNFADSRHIVVVFPLTTVSQVERG
jgi:hypothetical protein